MHIHPFAIELATEHHRSLVATAARYRLVASAHDRRRRLGHR